MRLGQRNIGVPEVRRSRRRARRWHDKGDRRRAKKLANGGRCFGSVEHTEKIKIRINDYGLKRRIIIG